MTIKVSKPAINIREELADLKQDTGIKGQELMRAETVAEARTAIGAGRKNLIINGAMNVSQRGTSFAAIANQAYSLDRWETTHQSDIAGTVTQDTTAPAGFATSYKFAVTTADTSLSAGHETSLYQKIEGQNLQGLAKGTSEAKAVTVSFWVKSNITGTFIAELMDNDNSNRHINKSYTIDTSDTWEYKTLTFAGDTIGVLGNDNGNSFHLAYWLAAGVDKSSGTLQTSWGALSQANRGTGQVNLVASTSNYWQITGVQLELGSVATEFEHRSYGEELALCQRYYYKIDGGGYTWIAEVQRHNNAGFRSVISLPVAIRDKPTISYSNLAYWYDNGSLVAGTSSISLGYTSSSATDITQLNIEYVPTSMSLTSNGNLSAMLSFTSAGGYLAFDAEL